MIATHLSLTNFRNFTRLELDLPPHIAVIQGENAQGKSNLLESIYLLATSRSHRAGNDRELINWSALEEAIPVSRLVADVQKKATKLKLEIALTAALPKVEDVSASERTPGNVSNVQKRIRINGIVRRAIDLIGQVNVVPFSVRDIDIIGGEPSLRRRYLDVTISQIDPHYLRQLQRYQKVVWQRNRLLRQIAHNQASRDEISFWDQELIKAGSYLIDSRQLTISALENLSQGIHDELSGERQQLTLSYIRSIGKVTGRTDFPVEETAGIFAQSLNALKDRELIQGVSLVGPHRDDLRFLTDGVDIGVFGSRGQQRTVALSLKLAQAELMRNKTGDHPILLLDDVLSELDYQRRNHLLGYVGGYQQVLITTTDLDYFDLGFLNQSVLFKISRGSIQPLSTR